MSYKLSSTSSRESSLVLLRNWRFARLMDCISSLFDIIFSVSLILRQSSRLSTTDLGFPSGVVMNSISGNSNVLDMVKSSCFSLMHSLAKGKVGVNKGDFVIPAEAGIQKKTTVVYRISRLRRSGMTYKHDSIFGSIKKVNDS
jgi:hypothetical protein